MTKIEFEYPEDKFSMTALRFPVLPGEFFHVTGRINNYPHYFGIGGKGNSPQEAIDAAMVELNTALARFPQGTYNVNVSRGPALDLSSLDDL